MDNNSKNGKNNVVVVIVLAVMYWFLAGRGIDEKPNVPNVPNVPVPSPVNPVNPLPLPPSPFPTPGEGEIGKNFIPQEVDNANSTNHNIDNSIDNEKSININTEKKSNGHWENRTVYVRGGLFGLRQIPVQKRIWINENNDSNTSSNVADCEPSG